MYEYFAIVGLPPDADVASSSARGGGDEDETLTVPASVIASWPPSAPQEIIGTLPGFVAPQGVRVHFVERTPSLSALNEIIYGSLRGLGEPSEDPYGDPPASRRFANAFGARRAVSVHPHSQGLSTAVSAALTAEASGAAAAAAPPPTAAGGAAATAPAGSVACQAAGSDSAAGLVYGGVAGAAASSASSTPTPLAPPATPGSRRAAEGGLAGSLAHAADLAGGIAHAAGDAVANLRFGGGSDGAFSPRRGDGRAISSSPRRSARSNGAADSPLGFGGAGAFGPGGPRNDAFVFSMAVTHSDGPHPRVLYGVAVFVQEMVQHVPTLARARWPGPPKRLRRRSAVALRAYCLLSTVPAFDLHLRVLHLLLGLERLDRIAALSAQLVPDGIAMPAWDSNAAERLRTLGLDDSEESGGEERCAAGAAGGGQAATAAAASAPAPEVVVAKALKASSSRASLAIAAPTGPYGTSAPLKSAKEISESSDEGIRRIAAIRAELERAAQALGLAGRKDAPESAAGHAPKPAASAGAAPTAADRVAISTMASAPPGGALALRPAPSGSGSPATTPLSAPARSSAAMPSGLGRLAAEAAGSSGDADDACDDAAGAVGAVDKPVAATDGGAEMGTPARAADSSTAAGRPADAPADGAVNGALGASSGDGAATDALAPPSGDGVAADELANAAPAAADAEGFADAVEPVATFSETFVDATPDASGASPSDDEAPGPESAEVPSIAASGSARGASPNSPGGADSAVPPPAISPGVSPPPLPEGSTASWQTSSAAASAPEASAGDAEVDSEPPARAGSVDSAAYTPFAAASRAGDVEPPAAPGAARRATTLRAQSSGLASAASQGDGSSRPPLPLSPRRTTSSQISRSPTPRRAASRPPTRGLGSRAASLPVAPTRSLSSESEAFATPAENGGASPALEEAAAATKASSHSPDDARLLSGGVAAAAPGSAAKLKPVRVPSAPASIDAPRAPDLTTRKVLVAFGQQDAPPYGGTLTFRPDPGLPALTWTRTDVAEASAHLGLVPGCVPAEDVEAAMELADWTLNAVCDALSVDSMLSFLTAVLLEQQTVVFCPDLGRLSAIVLALRPLMLPFSWQCLMLPVLPASPQHLELLDAPVPFVLGLQHKTSEVLARCKGHVRVNVYKDSVGGVSRLPALPRRAALADAVAPLHARLRVIARTEPNTSPLRCATAEARAVSRALLAAVRAHLSSLVEDIRYYSVTDISEANMRTSVLLRDAFVDAFPQKDRAFMRAFTDTQLFSVYSDLVLAAPK